ncbi:hypothetical protein ABBQ38_009875 [Trebouxia sp. C0009 RCD-2024]
MPFTSAHSTKPVICLQKAAVEAAERDREPVSHPLLDQVRACSTTPNAAANFFTAFLHPKPSARLTSAQALQHPYLRRCVSQMQKAQRTQAPSRSGPKFKRLRSALSHLFLGRNNQDNMSDFFPDYTHPSSDAELAADAVSVTVEPHVSSQQSTDRVPSPQTVAMSEPAVDVTSAVPGSAQAGASIKSHWVDLEIRSHPVEILPEDEEEIWVAEADPPTQWPRCCVHANKNSDQPHIRGQQGEGNGSSRGAVMMTADASSGLAPVSCPAQQGAPPGLKSDIPCVEESSHAKPSLHRGLLSVQFTLKGLVLIEVLG